MGTKEDRLNEIRKAKRLAEIDALQAAAPSYGDLAKQVLQGIPTAVNYGGSLARGAVESAPQTMIPRALIGALSTGSLEEGLRRAKEQTLKPETIKQTLLGNAPRLKTMYRELGVPEGTTSSEVFPNAYSETGNEWLKLQKGGMLDVTPLEAASAVQEQLIDPSNYVTMGGAPLLKNYPKVDMALKAAINPIEASGYGIGKGLYKSAFSKADELADQLKKYAPSEVAWEGNIYGGMNSISKQAQKQASKFNTIKDSIEQAATEAGGRVNPETALKKVKAKIAELRATKAPENMALADEFTDYLKSYEKYTPRPASQIVTEVPSKILDESGKPFITQVVENVPAEIGLTFPQASATKTSLFKKAKRAAFDPNKDTTGTQELLKLAGSGYKDAIEEGVGNALGEAQKQALQQNNAKLGSLLTVQKQFSKQAMSEAGKSPITAVDVMLASLGSPAAFAAKKGRDVIISPAFKTGIGLGIGKGAQYATPEAKAFLNYYRELQNGNNN